jgi:hypothetical protein
LILYRPVGLQELELIATASCREFPPRLSHQPVFYPVLNLEYAEQIARDWNTSDANSGFCGFVTQFEVPDPFVADFPVRVVGAAHHKELWVPAERLTDLNRHLTGPIRVIRAFYGPRCRVERNPGSDLPASVAAAFAAA